MQIYSFVASIPAITAVFVGQQFIHREVTLAKIDSLVALQAGWHYGSGKSISESVLQAIRLLHQKALDHQITETDVFPGRDGDVTLAVYRDGRDFSFRATENGEIEFDSESQEVPECGPLTIEEASDLLARLAQLETWNLFSSFTFATMMSDLAASEVWPSKIRATAVEYPYLIWSVQWQNPTTYVPTLVDSTPLLPQSLPSIGASAA